MSQDLSDLSVSSSETKIHIRYFPILLTLVAGFGLTFLMYRLVHQWENQQAALDFNRMANNMEQALERRLNSDISLIHSLQAFFSGARDVSADEFKNFVMQALAEKTGIQAMGWIPKVTDEERGTVESSFQNQGNKNFKITERNEKGELIFSPKSTDYYPMVYLEPLAGYEYALGFNMISRPDYATVMQKTREERSHRATSRINMKVGTSLVAGFFVFAPVFVDHDLLKGYVTTVIHVDKLVAFALEGLDDSGLHIVLSETQDEGSKKKLLFKNREGFFKNPDAKNSFEWIAPLPVAGQIWTIAIYPDRSFFEKTKFSRGHIVLTSGFVVTLLMVAYLVVFFGRAAQVEKMVAHRTAQLSKANERLADEIGKRKQLEKMKDEFISTVSHEIRTPITLIKSSISNLKDGVLGPMEEKQKDMLTKTLRFIDRLNRIIGDLLDLSRLESGKTKVNRADIDTEQLVNEIVQNFQTAACEKNISLTTDMTGIVPKIYADEDMMVQVLNNLVDNALRYARSKVVICVKTEIEEKGMVQISVEDDGLGIEKSSMDLLFTKFSQIKRPQGGGGYKGTGLGLVICKEIMSLHHGKIWAESTVGSGTLFYFELPQYDMASDFREHLQEALFQAEKNKSNLAVAALTLESFKDMRLQAGEKVVEKIMDIMELAIRKEALRKTDYLSRYVSLNHLVMLLDEAGREAVTLIEKRLQKAVAGCEMHPDSKFKLSPMIGIAHYPQDALDPEGLIQHALNEANGVKEKKEVFA